MASDRPHIWHIFPANDFKRPEKSDHSFELIRLAYVSLLMIATLSKTPPPLIQKNKSREEQPSDLSLKSRQSFNPLGREKRRFWSVAELGTGRIPSIMERKRTGDLRAEPSTSNRPFR